MTRRDAREAAGYLEGDRRALFERRMLECPLRVPALYLYSAADEITEPEFVERVMRQRTRQGVDVHCKR